MHYIAFVNEVLVLQFELMDFSLIGVILIISFVQLLLKGSDFIFVVSNQGIVVALIFIVYDGSSSGNF